MSKHFYAFGSVCRGEADMGSDVDLLACASKPLPDIDPKTFSIYTYRRIEQLWKEGNPFAWHLHLESRLLFSSDGSDFICDLGRPMAYTRAPADCAKFLQLFLSSHEALRETGNSAVFHLSSMFLAMRNFSTCYSFTRGRPIFSRAAPLLIDSPGPIPSNIFDVLSRARILSTRGFGNDISSREVISVLEAVPAIIDWMQDLIPAGALHE